MSLAGKSGLVFGVANDRSIAWGIAQALAADGARLGFGYTVPVLESRVVRLAKSVGSEWIEYCDLTSDDSIADTFESAREHFGEIDFLVHSIAFAPRDDLTGRFFETTREGFLTAHEISVYSFLALTRACLPLFPAGSGSILTLTYHGAQKVMPSYKVMGVAKAALESTVRYLADDLGPQGVRVNAISAGPVRTLASGGVKGFKDFYRAFPDAAPLRRHVTQEEIGGVARFLCDEDSRGITGEVLYVDSGFHVLGAMADLDR